MNLVARLPLASPRRVSAALSAATSGAAAARRAAAASSSSAGGRGLFVAPLLHVAAPQPEAGSSMVAPSVRLLSTDSITYSGGQPTAGQGGYYGSGGARASGESHESDAVNATESERTKVLAMAADVQTIAAVMNEVSTLESILESEEGSGNPSKTMEIRNAIKKLMTSADVTSALNRLYVQGEPVWGLSVSERDMISYAREKVNEC